MTDQSTTLAEPSVLDYSLTGPQASWAVKNGLAEASWYQCPVPRETMRSLLQRRDGPALRDTAIWFSLIIASGAGVCLLWNSPWYLLAIPLYLVYSALYASTSDSRWHEAGHGTAFKTDWMNNALYEIASFMVMRESVIWRWSHVRHHSDTIIVGRDPEIAVPRPPNLGKMFLGAFNLTNYYPYFKQIALHSIGRINDHEKTFLPADEFSKVIVRARLYVLIYIAVAALSIYLHSFLPLLLIGLPNFFGTWLMGIYGYTQHAGLAENVLDHRLNCRTVYMNLINRFLYWNMNYHLEHHMFPLVPYHALPRLHAIIKDDCPAPYPSLIAAWKEIIPAVWRQVSDPGYFVRREIPCPAVPVATAANSHFKQQAADGWTEVCASDALARSDVIRHDHAGKTFAIVRNEDGKLHAFDGICTHGKTHLADGLVRDGTIECPKHNGRFHLADGSPARRPICRGLGTYPIEERDGRIFVNTESAKTVAA